MNSLRIMGPKQIKAEHLVAMAVHMEWLATVLSPSNIFTLFMKYFISSIANAKYKSQGDALCLSSWSCGMPVPVLHSFFFGKAGCLFTRHTAFDSPILLSFNKLKKKEKGREERKKETSISSHWQIETMNKRDNLICSCGKSDSRLRFIPCTPGHKLKKKVEGIMISYRICSLQKKQIVHIIIIL